MKGQWEMAPEQEKNVKVGVKLKVLGKEGLLL